MLTAELRERGKEERRCVLSDFTRKGGKDAIREVAMHGYDLLTRSLWFARHKFHVLMGLLGM